MPKKTINDYTFYKITNINGDVDLNYIGSTSNMKQRRRAHKSDCYNVNTKRHHLKLYETIRAHGTVRMGLIDSIEQAAGRQHTPKVAFVAKPIDYVASSGKQVASADIDLNVRALSMGKLHHAMMGTAAVAIATAAAIPGTLVNLAAGGGERQSVRFGHPSGTLRVGAEASQYDGDWVVKKVIMSRSARVLMEGWVRVPGDAF